jgi:Fe-S oxidoreductase
MGLVAMVKPEIIATANVGCMLQFQAGAKRKGMNTEVAHVIELLDRAYSTPDVPASGARV